MAEYPPVYAAEGESKEDDLLLPVDLCGFNLSSPTMLASGILGISFDLFPRIIKSGCGAIVTKSIGLEPREGYRNPTMTGVEAGYINAIGLANPGAKVFAEEMAAFSTRPESRTTPIIASIFADSPDNFARLVRNFDSLDFVAFELNLSCPHVKDVGSEIGSDVSLSCAVVKAVKNETEKPVLVKMPASIPNVSTWGREVERAGADGIVAINTIRAMVIDLQTQKPILSNKVGGLSGNAIRPVGVRSVYELYEAVNVPIIGVGGVSQWSHAVEYILAGAACVQIGSAMALDYLGTFSKINEGVLTYMSDHGYGAMREMIGAAHP